MTMLRSLHQLYGKTLGALDGETGRVENIFFDNQRWALRYANADTGAWLTGRFVMIPPHVFGDFYENGRSLPVRLTKKRIEDIPISDEQKPASRQCEKAHRKYYEWPTCWDSVEMSVAAGVQVVP